MPVPSVSGKRHEEPRWSLFRGELTAFVFRTEPNSINVTVATHPLPACDYGDIQLARAFFQPRFVV